MNSAKISIIIPSYNQGFYLERTLASIVNQDYPNLEIIIMDGGSNDNSVEVIKKYEPHLSYWQSGKDGGQTDALLKGFARATGDLVGWQNSDDIYMPGSFELVVRKFMDCNCKSGVYFGNMITIDANDQPIHYHRYTPFNVNELMYSGWNITNQSCFFTLDTIRSLSVSREYKYSMDAAIFLNIYHNGFKFFYINRFLGCLRMHANTKTSNIGLEIGFSEWVKIRKEYGVSMHPTRKWSHQFPLHKSYFKMRKFFYFSYFAIIKFLSRAAD